MRTITPESWDGRVSKALQKEIRDVCEKYLFEEAYYDAHPGTLEIYNIRIEKDIKKLLEDMKEQKQITNFRIENVNADKDKVTINMRCHTLTPPVTIDFSLHNNYVYIFNDKTNIWKELEERLNNV